MLKKVRHRKKRGAASRTMPSVLGEKNGIYDKKVPAQHFTTYFMPWSPLQYYVLLYYCSTGLFVGG